MIIELATSKDKAGIQRYDHIPSARLDECIRGGQVYVLKDGDIVVGVLRFGLFWQTLPFLDLIYLDETCRGRGFGTRLMQRWEEDMSRAGYNFVLTSTQADETAWRFYEKLGYRKTGSFLPPEQDFYELIYVKSLHIKDTKQPEPTDGKHEVLSRYFGYSEFRGGQAELIDAQVAGRDVFGIMPTGGGKSICYQVPALLTDGITLVISPLISLMKDQVAALKNAGVAAAYINSSLSPEQIRAVFHNMLNSKYKLVYVAPERLLTDGFLEVVRNINVSMVAVDEAHCISQWGQDFRPSYLKIVDFLKMLPKRPVVSAFTATATGQVRDDVVRILGLREPLCIVTGFDRPNLHFEVLRPRNKPATLLQLVTERKDKSGIIYCATRKEVEKVCEALQLSGFSATRYHAGLSEDERVANQDDFIYDRRNIMVATNAFGMGIDKSNVSYVIHYNMPKSMEAYYQEAGRAGRDGEAAECILMFSAGDIQTAKFFIQRPSGNEGLTEDQRREVIEQDLERLNRMIGYCKTPHCLRGYIMDYFGQEHSDVCNNCGNCDPDAVETDITTEAKMVLSCIRRIHDHLGYDLGETVVVRVLYGSAEKRVKQLGLDRLSTYGLMSNVERSRIREIIESLESQGYLCTDTEHGALRLTSRADEVLFRGQGVTMRVSAGSGSKAPKPSNTADRDLLSALKELRMQIAKRERTPAYVIFSNATLQDMADKAPVTEDELLSVSGVGKYKAAHYGEAFLEAIRNFKQTE